MKFPLLKNEKFKYPPGNKCAWCGVIKISEPHSMAVIGGGAMLVNRKTGDGGPDPRLDGFLSMAWHGAHPEEGGKGKRPGVYQSLEIAKDIKGGQFEVYFCSTKCLRAFLNHAVDMLEKKIF